MQTIETHQIYHDNVWSNNMFENEKKNQQKQQQQQRAIHKAYKP